MNNKPCYVITGVTGRTGAAAALALLNAGERVRVVVRDAAKGHYWENLGTEVAVADLSDPVALTAAFSNAQGAYIVSPPQYARKDLFVQAETMASIIAGAAVKAGLSKVVALSSVGAEQQSGIGWISMNRMLEQHLFHSGLNVTALRAAYFMENWSAVVDSVTGQGVLPSFIAPLDGKLPMIATADIGRMAAEALLEKWKGTRVIELEGPREYSPNDIAETFSRILNKSIRSVAIPESDWEAAMAHQGFSSEALAGFIEMTQALNSGHIRFSPPLSVEHRNGSIFFDDIASTIVRV